jgi:hypothetical protein
MRTLQRARRIHAAARMALRRTGQVGLAVMAASALASLPAQAVESAASLYLLGSGGPGTAVMPPIEGVFFANSAYYYDGQAGAGREFLIGGKVVTDVKATVIADFPTILWVPTTNLGGGALALGLVLPFGQPDIGVSATLAGPRGNAIGASRSDSQTVWGDPVLTGMMGWKTGNWNIQGSTLVNVPIGQYRKDKLANLAFHRWAADASLAASWRNESTGWDVTGKGGFTFNGENDYTDYDSGTEFHLEASIEKTISPSYSIGMQSYYYYQVTGDSGSGARLGSFKGMVTGVGATGAYNFKIADKIPASLRLRAFTEFNTKNRLNGNSVFLDFSMPLHVKMPAGAPAT